MAVRLSQEGNPATSAVISTMREPVPRRHTVLHAAQRIPVVLAPDLADAFGSKDVLILQ
jgi:hypothetical protein